MMTTILGMLGALQGLILGVAVASLGGSNRRPNRALAFVLLNLSITVFLITGEHGGLFGNSIYPVLLEYTLLFFFPPALWHYANTVLGRRNLLVTRLNFLPAAAWVIYLVAFRAGWTTWRWLPPIMPVVIYSAAYTLAIAIRLWRSRSRATALASHHAVLAGLVICLGIVHVSQAVRYVFNDVSVLSDIVPLTTTATLAILSVLAFRRSRLFAAREPASTPKKYQSSTLTPDRTEEIQSRLVTTMERDKPFLNENLNLADMAARLKVSRSELSQVVNGSVGCSFSELLSRYRVREAERVLGDPRLRHLTIEAIGYEAGFRSRSAFHSAFKREKGETPAQFRSRL
jgi:AraC-like DNA-binding protein